MMTVAELEQQAMPEVVAAIMACRVFLGTSAGDQLVTFVKEREVDHEGLYDVVRAHHIRPVVNKAAADARLNSTLSSLLQADCRQLTLSSFEHYRELLRLNELLQEAGILAVPYKGCMFGRQFYNDLSLREFSDLDFLVQPTIETVDAVTKVMQAAGYKIAFDAPEEFREFYISHIREFKYVMMGDGRRKFLVEFHTLLNDPVFDTTAPMANAYLFEDLQPETLSGSEIRLLSPTKHFIAMLTHHGIREQWTSLKNVMDLAVAVQSVKVDWEEVIAAADTYRCRKVLANGLAMAEELFGVSPNLPYKGATNLSPWLQRLFVKHLYPTGRTWRDNFWLKLKARDSAADQMRMLFNHLRYLGTPSILDYKFVRLPRPLFFLYVVVKPIRMLIG